MAFTPPSIHDVYENQQYTGPLSQSILLALVIVLIGWFLVKPQFTEFNAQHDQLKAANSQMDALDKEKADLDRLVSQMQSSEQQVKITDEALPLTSRVSRVDVLVDSLARSAGMQVAQIEALGDENIPAAANKAVLKDPFAAARSLQTTKVTVAVSGSIDQFRNFLQLLETSGRLIDVSSLSLTSGDGVTKFNMEMKTYSYDVATK
jgi:Tfp pilus assembly protein PilO